MTKRQKVVVVVSGSGTAIFASFGVEVIVLEEWSAGTIWGIAAGFGVLTLLAWLAPSRWFESLPRKRRRAKPQGSQEPDSPTGSSLARRIEEVTDKAATFYGPMATVGMIRALHPDLTAQGILCPPPPQETSLSLVDDWIWLLTEIHPFVESGNMDKARTLYLDLKRMRGY